MLSKQRAVCHTEVEREQERHQGHYLYQQVNTQHAPAAELKKKALALTMDF